MKNLLSVIVPAYNEEKSIADSLKVIFEVDPFKEVIVINDCSKDGTGRILEEIQKKINKNKPANLKELKVINKERNEGKGAAIRTALNHVSGDIVLIQDADLELDPREYVKLLEPFDKLGADVVFGSRFRREGIMRVHDTWHFFGNKVLTWFSNFFSGLYLTDMETCYKVMKSDLIKSFKLKSNRFGIEPELAAKVAGAVKKNRLNFYEVPVSYRPRTRAEGKKIGIKDGLVALFSIIYFNIFDK